MWFELSNFDTLRYEIDEFVKDKHVISISITTTTGPDTFLAVVVYKENAKRA